MEVKYRSADGRFEVMFDEKSQDTLFKQIASFQEVFEDDANVVIEGKKVPSSDIRLRVRTNQGNEFYEKVYVGNDKDLYGYKMEYGSSKENKGCLFPKKKDSEGKYYKNNGWHKWEGEKQGGKSEATPETDTSTKGVKAPF